MPTRCAARGAASCGAATSRLAAAVLQQREGMRGLRVTQAGRSEGRARPSGGAAVDVLPRLTGSDRAPKTSEACDLSLRPTGVRCWDRRAPNVLGGDRRAALHLLQQTCTVRVSTAIGPWSSSGAGFALTPMQACINLTEQSRKLCGSDRNLCKVRCHWRRRSSGVVALCPTGGLLWPE